MTLPRFDDVRLSPRGHWPALRLLAATYCCLRRLDQAGESLSTQQRARVLLATWIHVLPYVVVVWFLARGTLFLTVATDRTSLSEWFFPSGIGLVGGIGIGLVVGIVVGIVGGLVVGLVVGIVGGIVVGLVVGLVGGLGAGLGLGIVGGIVGGLVVGLGGGLGGGLGVGIVAGIVAGLVAGLGVGLVGGIGIGVGLGVGIGAVLGVVSTFFRWYYLPFHVVLARSATPRTFLRFHPVFWDEACAMPFPSLDRALVRVAEQDPRAGMAAIDHLITDYPYQRLGALRAKAILVARAAARVPGLTDLDGVLASLPEGERGFLGHIRELREKASAISRQQRFVEATTRPFFKEQALQMLRSEIHAFSSQIGGFPEPLASEFRRAAESWLRLADAQRREVETLRSREPTPQIFRAGDPVQRDAEAFIPRLEVVGTLENEIMAGSGCPGLLLYGRRRLGKSTAIRNLDGFLPESVSTVVVSMQDPEARISDASWTRLLAKEIRRVWSRAPDSPAAVLGVVPFFQFLSACNEQLAAEGRRLLLCLDEYEELDKAVGDHRFDEGLPAMFRESIQTHRRITWLFAGSHHFGELTHIRWSSFLVSVRTVEITPFSLPETQTLLTNPLQHSRRADARHAIRMFGPAFWGDGGMERIHAETGGWPHLVQLVAATVVDLCNTHGLTHPSPDLLEEALTKSVVSGDTVFAELMLYRSKEYPSAWPYLREFRTRERQPPPEDALRLTLKRHLLIKETDDGQWMLRVPLMARWLRERM